jgi:hypothetical protein
MDYLKKEIPPGIHDAGIVIPGLDEQEQYANVLTTMEKIRLQATGELPERTKKIVQDFSKEYFERISRKRKSVFSQEIERNEDTEQDEIYKIPPSLSNLLYELFQLRKSETNQGVESLMSEYSEEKLKNELISLAKHIAKLKTGEDDVMLLLLLEQVGLSLFWDHKNNYLNNARIVHRDAYVQALFHDLIHGKSRRMFSHLEVIRYCEILAKEYAYGALTIPGLLDIYDQFIVGAKSMLTTNAQNDPLVDKALLELKRSMEDSLKQNY